MSEIRDVDEGPPRLFAQTEVETRQFLHVLERRPLLEISGGVDPERGAAVPPELAGHGLPAAGVEAERIQEDIEPVGPEFPGEKIVEEENIEGRAQPGQAPEPLLEYQRDVQIVAACFIKKALVVEKDGDFRGRRAVEGHGALPDVLELAEQSPKLRDFGRVHLPKRPPGPLAVGQEVGQVPPQDRAARRERLDLAVIGVLAVGVSPRVVFDEEEFAVEADRLGREHARRVPAHPAESVGVGADQEIDVGRREHPAQAQVPGPLIGRIIGIRPLPEEPTVPGQVEEVAVERAGQAVPARLLFDRPAQIDDGIAAEVGERLEIIDDVLFGRGVAEGVEAGFELAFGPGDRGRVERDGRRMPGCAQLGDVVPVTLPEPVPEVEPHGTAEVAARGVHRGLALDPFARVAGPDLVGDDAVVEPGFPEMPDIGAEKLLGLLPPDFRGEGHPVPPAVGQDFAFVEMRFFPPVVVPGLEVDAEMEQGAGVGLEHAPEPGLDRREIEIARAARPGADPLRPLADVEGINVEAGLRAQAGLLLEIPPVRPGARYPVDGREDRLPVEKEGRASVERLDLRAADAARLRWAEQGKRAGRPGFAPGQSEHGERGDFQNIPAFHWNPPRSSGVPRRAAGPVGRPSSFPGPLTRYRAGAGISRRSRIACSLRVRRGARGPRALSGRPGSARPAPKG